ncbi:MAG: sodium:proton antiporter [Melioribacteraceae bacterium]|nr:sodium:proton antiporter [Melioribacteraceae bacterium]
MKKLSSKISFFLFFIFFANNIFASGSEGTENLLPNPFMVLPFAILLLMIATGPLFYHHFWERNYPKIALALGSVTVIYYLIFLNDTHSLIHTLTEYISFIALLASLFVASGGILIKVDKKSTPMLNVMILLFGAVISNIIGTTGASMLLIRPYIKVNRDRIKAYHIVFFIFAVSNIGGALDPIGDPPLFLGFLRGIGFFWFFEHIFVVWVPTLLALMTIFYIIDSRNKGEEKPGVEYTGKIEFRGGKNVIFLAIILLSVFIDPGIIKWIPSLTPLPFGIREIIMLSVVYFSYKYADKKILEANEFNFEPIREVAFLFVGIFATMIPALQLIEHESKIYGHELTPGIFYWATGSLSALLDNAPTFLNFLSAALGKYGMDVDVKQQVYDFSLTYPIYVQAISIAAVFFGAMTYIGNGPNFMVKSICERAGIKMPSFFGFLIKYSIPILLPIFFIIWLLVFYGKV